MIYILLFHFILLLISIVLFIVGISTSRWLVYVNTNPTGIISEQSHGIVEICQRLFREGNTNRYWMINNPTESDNYESDGGYMCFNYLFKWHNSSIYGPELLGYQKALIGISFGCVFVAIISLLLTQLIDTEVSFYKIRRSKRIIDYLLITDILTVILALLTLILFVGFEHLQNVLNCGYSFWSFVMGTCCVFLCCILVAVFRIDIEFEYHRLRYESVAKLY